jgi:acyl-CoA dehydrogenase
VQSRTPQDAGLATRLLPWDLDYFGYRDAVRRFVADEVMPHQSRWRADRHAGREVWRQAGQLGMLLPDVPGDYGGGGGAATHAAVLPQELVLAGDTCLGGVVVQAAVAQYLLRHGTAEQKARCLPRLAAGTWIAAIAMSDPDTSTDIGGTRSTVTACPDGYLLNGTERHVSNGHLADLILVAATLPASPGRIALLLVERDGVTGVRSGPIPDMIGRRGHDVCDLFFDDVMLPPDAVLGGTSGSGLGQMMSELPYERTLIGATAVAAIERAVTLAVQHARTRMLSGRTLFDLQNTRFRLAEAKTHAVVARTFIERCLAQLGDGGLRPEMAAMAKWFLTEMEGKVIDQCLQLFGGDGYMADHPVAQLYTGARIQRIDGGVNEVMLEMIAGAM